MKLLHGISRPQLFGILFLFSVLCVCPVRAQEESATSKVYLKLLAPADAPHFTGTPPSLHFGMQALPPPLLDGQAAISLTDDVSLWVSDETDTGFKLSVSISDLVGESRSIPCSLTLDEPDTREDAPGMHELRWPSGSIHLLIRESDAVSIVPGDYAATVTWSLSYGP